MINFFTLHFKGIIFTDLFPERPHTPLVGPISVSHGSKESCKDDGRVEDTLGRDPLVVYWGIASLRGQVLLIWHGRHSSEKVTVN